MRNLIFLILIFLVLPAYSQDSTRMLLLNTNVQFECDEAITDLYNFKFDRAQKQFEIIKLKYPDHPLPYFLMGLGTWWKMMPNLKVKTYDEDFLAFLDTTIQKAETVYKDPGTKIEGAFFLSAAYGFKAEFFGERESYTKATFAGKNALKYLMEYKDNNQLSPEFLYGVGLYNYYEVWIKEEYPMLKPILLFFPNGNKELGKKQLEEVAQNAFYARTEALADLGRIYMDTSKTYRKALEVFKFLHQQYSDNPYFHKLYMRCAWQTGIVYEYEREASEVIRKYDEKFTGYEENAVRWAYYYLADLYMNRNLDSSKKYFLKSIEYAEKAGATDQGYYYHSFAGLAEIAEKQKNKEEAELYYKKLRKILPKGDKDYYKLRNEVREGLGKRPRKKFTKSASP